MSTTRLKAIMLPAVKALFPPERIAREKATDLVITQDGRVRADRLHGFLGTPNLTSFDSSSITTSEPSAVSFAESLDDFLQDLSDSIVDATVVAVDTASVDMTATPTFSGTEISADVIYAGTGSADTAARSDHSHSLTATATLDFPSIAAQTCSALTITVTGAAVGDAVDLGAPSTIEANLTWSGYVSAVNTVTVRVCNCTVGAIDPASATWRATVR